MGGETLATSEAYCVCRSSRLALLSVCWALACPHAGNTGSGGRQCRKDIVRTRTGCKAYSRVSATEDV